MASEPRWRSYELIGSTSRQASAFREGAIRHGNAREQCPLCDGRRLHREDASPFCRLHNSWLCVTALWIACHSCKVRWVVAVNSEHDEMTYEESRSQRRALLHLPPSDAPATAAACSIGSEFAP